MKGTNPYLLEEVKSEVTALCAELNRMLESDIRVSENIEKVSTWLFFMAVAGGLIAIFSEFWIAIVSLAFAIPDSRFKRITNIKDWQIFWIALSQLVAEGWQTYGLSRTPSINSNGIRPVTADPLDKDGLRNALEQINPTQVFFTTWMRKETKRKTSQ